MKSLSLVLFYISMLSLPTGAQSWNFIKEKDGIKLYSRDEPGKPIKAFRCVTDIKAPAEKIFDLLNDINRTDWWDENLTIAKVLHYEKNKSARYYMVYKLPWPVTDRDLCVDVTASTDMESGERKITVISVSGIIPERSDMIRIEDYRETWTVKPVDEGTSEVSLEGFIDPAGKIPDWLANKILVESPVKTVGKLRESIKGD
jgi:hypothetical protein